MNLRLSLLLLLLGGAFSGRVHAQYWAGLQVGMTENQVIEVLGAPLLASKGRGYSSWIYDHGGRAMLHGGVLLYWSTPTNYDPRSLAFAPPRTFPASQRATVVAAPSERSRSTTGAQRPIAPRGYVYR